MHKYALLHIEDNKADAVLLNLHLKSSPFAEFQVHWMKTLKEGLEYLTKHSPDAILLDLGLPDVVGFEGLKTLVLEYPSIPVVVHTGLENAIIGLEAIELGAQDFLQKDRIDPVMIGKTINFAIERAKQVHIIHEQKAKLQQLSVAVDQSANSVVITDTDGKIEFVNKKFCEVTGYSKEEVMGQNPRVLKSGKQPKRFYDRMWKRISNGETWVGYFENHKKDGSSFLEKASISPVLDDNGIVTHYIAIKEDISDLKSAETLNMSTGERVSALFENSHTSIIYVNREGVLELANKKSEEILGYNKEQMADFTYMSKDWQAQHVDGRPFEENEFPAAITLKTKKRLANVLMSVYQPIKNKRVWLSVDTIPLFEKGDDEITGVFTVFRDLTEEVESTLALEKYASKLKIAQEIGKSGYWEWDYSKEGYYWSDQLKIVFGETSERKYFGIDDWRKILHPEDKDSAYAFFADAVKHRRADKMEYRIILEDGSTRYIEEAWTFIEESPLQKAHAIGVARDVTEIKESEEKILLASKAAHIGHWSYDIQKDVLTWTNETYEIYGINKNEKSLSFETFSNVVHPDDYEYALEQYEKAITVGGDFNFEHRISTPNGVKWVEESGRVIHDQQGTPIYTFGVVKDITVLKQSEQRLIEASEAGNLGQWHYEIKNDRFRWSKQTYKILGVDERLADINLAFYWDLIHQLDLPHVQEAYEKAWEEKKAFNYQFRLANTTPTKYVEASGKYLFNEKGEPLGSSGVLKDITQLKNNELRFIQASKAANLGHWRLNVATQELWWSDQTFEIYGVDKDQKVDVDFYWTLVHPKDVELAQEVFQRGLTETGAIDGQYRILVKGEVRYVEVNGKFNFDREGNPLEATGVARDITELKAAENRLELASKAANVGIWSYNILEDTYWVSEQVFDIFDVKDQNIENFNFEFFMSFVFEEDMPIVLKTYEDSLNAENGFEYGHRIKTSKGIRYVQYSGQVIKNDAGEPIMSTGTVMDITALKKAEEKALENQARLNSILNSFDDMIFVLNDEGIYQDFFSSKDGSRPRIQPEAFLGKHYKDTLPSHVGLLMEKSFQKVKENEGIEEVEYSLDESNGETSYWNAKVSRLMEPFLGYTILVRDITEKKKVEKELILNEAKYREHSDYLPHILWTGNEKGESTYLNQVGLDFYGLNIGEFREKSWGILHRECLEVSKRKWKKAIHKKQPYINTERHINGAGEYRWLDVQANPVLDGDELIGWVGVSTDVHREFLAKQENEQLVFELGERIKEAGLLYKVTQLKIEFADDLEELFQRVASEIPEGFLCPECTKASIQYHGKKHQEGPIRYKNKMSFPIVVNQVKVGNVTVGIASKDMEGKPLKFLKEEFLLISAVADNLGLAIERYLSHKELKQNEAKYREVFENLQEGYVLLDTNGQVIEANAEAGKILRTTKNELIDQNIHRFIKGEQFLWKKALAEGSVKDLVLNMSCADGMPIIASFNIRTINHMDDRWMFEVTFTDITRTTKLNRLAEYSLKLYASISKSTTEFIQDGIDYAVELLDSKAGFYHFVNEEEGTIKLVQWSMGTKEVCQVPQLVADYKIEDSGIWVECLKTGEPVIHNDYEALTKKGGLPKGHFPITRDLEIPIIQEGKAVGILRVGNKETYYDELDKEVLKSYSTLFHSIVQKKQLEDEYLETLRSFEQSQKAAKIGAWRYDIVYNKTWWSDTMYDIYEIPKAEGIPEENWLDYTHPEDREMQQKVFADAQKTGGYDLHYRLLLKTGDVKYVHAKSTVVFDSNNKPLRHVGILQDVTEMKNAQSLIEEKSTQFESIVESLNGFVYRLREDESFDYLSTSFTDILGFDKDDFLRGVNDPNQTNFNFDRIIQQDDRESQIEKVKQSFKSGEPFVLSYRMKKQDGSTIWVSDSGKILIDNNGQKIRQGYITDVTEKVRAEEKIMNAVMKASDGEKARISKEIHDSLQQTLAIAALNLEFVKKDEDQLSDFVKRKYATGWEYLKRSMNDTRAIAHRLMPKAIEDFGLVPVLKDMVDDLNRSTGLEFEFLTNMEGRRIQVPMATNLYKLVQEAVNNILKHAKAQNVTIQYMGLGDIIQLIVEDDGKGFKIERIDNTKGGFGLASMKSRATALGAECIIDSFPEHGTTIMVEVPYTKELEYYE